MNENKQTSHNLGQQAPESQRSFFYRYKIILIVAIVVLAAAIAVVIYLMTSQNGVRQSSQTNGEANKDTGPSAFLQQYGQNCKNRDVAFTSAPMNMDELSYIRPLGAVSDGHVTPTDHVYIGGPNPQAADNTYAVLMPAEGTVTEVSAMPAQYIGDRSGQQVASEDHRLVISHSCRYFSIFIHVHKLSDAVKAAVGTLEPNKSKQANIELKAGDVVGYIGGSTFDWTPIDTSKKLKGFITASIYQGESWKIHTVSPFDLYTGSLKTQLEAKSLRTVKPVGGKIDYDQPGKLIGNWFREGSGGYSGGDQNEGRYWDGHLSIAPDYIDPTSTVVSIGNWTGSAAQFVVSGSVDPADVTRQDGMVAYELKKLNYVDANGQAWQGGSLAKGVHPSQSGSVLGTIAFEVLPDEKLKVEKFPGKSASAIQGFTSAAQIYER